MKLPELSRRVRQHLAEAGQTLLTDDDIAAQIGRSAKGLAKEYALFKGSGTASVANGTFTLPSDFGGFFGPLTDRIHELTPMTPDDYARRQQLYGGSPPNPAAYYWGEEYGGSVQVWGTPTSDLVFGYIRIPPAPDATTEAWGGAYEEYHDLIALHAADRLMTRQGPSAAASMAWAQRFTQRLGEFAAMMAMKKIGSAPLRLQVSPHRRY